MQEEIAVKKTVFMIVLALCASALLAQVVVNQPPPAPPSGQTAAAPAGNPLVAEARQAYNSVKTNLTGMAAKMPPENYDFKPVADIRTFGELMAHIADTQTMYCSSAAGQQKRGDAASKKSKADIVAALTASFAECDAAWDGTNDANAGVMVGGGRMQRSRLGMLIGNTIHDNEEYGYGSVYLRLKGVVPPSSDRGAMGGGMGAGRGPGR